ncbi:MAG TPA: hypothetical protein VIK26_10965 [Clostridium sp.]
MLTSKESFIAEAQGMLAGLEGFPVKLRKLEVIIDDIRSKNIKNGPVVESFIVELQIELDKLSNELDQYTSAVVELNNRISLYQKKVDLSLNTVNFVL